MMTNPGSVDLALLFVELDQQHLCLNAAYKLFTPAQYQVYRKKPVFKECFHHAQLVLMTPVFPVFQLLADPEVDALLRKLRRHLQVSPAFRQLDLGTTEVRLLLLEASVSRAKTRAEYFVHPLAGEIY